MNTALLNEVTSEAESLLHTIEETEKQYLEEIRESLGSVEQSPSQEMMDTIEDNIDLSGLNGLQKTRAIQQKIELQNIKGQSLSMIIPEIGDRAVFRIVFQILFQSQRLVELLAAYALVEAKEVQMVVADLSDALTIGTESTRLSEEQKSMITALAEELNELKLEFQKSSLEQLAEKIKVFENNLEEKIQLMNQWMEPYFGIFEN